MTLPISERYEAWRKIATRYKIVPDRGNPFVKMGDVIVPVTILDEVLRVAKRVNGTFDYSAGQSVNAEVIRVPSDKRWRVYYSYGSIDSGDNRMTRLSIQDDNGSVQINQFSASSENLHAWSPAALMEPESRLLLNLNGTGTSAGVVSISCWVEEEDAF